MAAIAMHLLGIDIGTTGAKAVLIDRAGDVIADHTTEYPLDTPRPLWAEQNPQHWFDATIASIRAVVTRAAVSPGSIAAVGLTGQMHGMTLLDRVGELLRPAILWNDQRTAAECAEMTRRIGAARVLELTANAILPGFTAPKLEWTRKHEPEVYGRIDRVLLPKDYVRYRLSGEYATDVADASGTSWLDVRRRDWSDEMLVALNVPKRWLPSVFESPAICAQISAEAAALSGLAVGTPIVAGAGDQAAQAVGSGVVDEGTIAVTIGTSGVVFASCDAFRADAGGRLHSFCHAVPGKWHLMGVMLSAAGCLRWFRDALAPDVVARAAWEHRDVYDLLCAEAATAPAGCDGLTFLPYLSGERTPHVDPNARGVFFGLTLRHSRAHMIRAVLEGVSFGLRDSLELMRSLGVPIREIRSSGGGARNGLWRQIAADIFGAPVVRVNTTQGAAYGAALLAGVGIGVFASVAEASRRAVQVVDETRPGEGTEHYESAYRRYRGLYPALAASFAAASKL